MSEHAPTVAEALAIVRAAARLPLPSKLTKEPPKGTRHGRRERKEAAV